MKQKEYDFFYLLVDSFEDALRNAGSSIDPFEFQLRADQRPDEDCLVYTHKLLIDMWAKGTHLALNGKPVYDGAVALITTLLTILIYSYGIPEGIKGDFYHQSFKRLLSYRKSCENVLFTALSLRHMLGDVQVVAMLSQQSNFTLLANLLAESRKPE